jgi:argininosuccinate lyase/amino-acid N-acetyltransferase
MTPAAWAATRGRLTIDSVLGRRNVHGGTAPARVRRALDEAASRLARRGISVAPPDAGSAPAALTIRQARIDDLDDICRLVDYWTREGENLPRSREAILEAIADFGVAERGGTVIGCGSLSIYTPALAEIRSLGVDPAHHGGGAGSALVRHFLEQAAVLHIPRVFVLTRAPAFFERLGFRVVSIDTLPEKVFKDCNACPKKHCCDEIAMVHEVATVPAAGTAGVMRLRVVGA